MVLTIRAHHPNEIRLSTLSNTSSGSRSLQRRTKLKTILVCSILLSMTMLLAMLAVRRRTAELLEWQQRQQFLMATQSVATASTTTKFHLLRIWW